MNKLLSNLVPKTATGRWSLGLVIAMPILFIAGSSLADSVYQSVPAGDSIFADLAARPVLALAMLAGMAAGIAGFLIGLMAIFVREERSFLVYLATLAGGLLMILLAGEILSSH